MATGGFKLRKWLTNDAALRKQIGEHESASNTKQVTRLDDFETYAQSSLGIPQDNSCDKVLGFMWDCEKDLIKFDLLKLVESLKDKQLTLKLRMGSYTTPGHLPVLFSPFLTGLRVDEAANACNAIWDNFALFACQTCESLLEI